MNLLTIARSLDLNIVGVCFHVGTQVQDSFIYKEALQICRRIFDEAKGLGYNFYLVDIGGGYEGAKGSSIKEVIDCKQ